MRTRIWTIFDVQMTNGNGWSGFVGWAGAKVFGYLYVRNLMGV